MVDLIWLREYFLIFNIDNFDILINATSIGLFPNVSDKPDIDYDTINANMVICDVIPNPPDTPFLKESRARGAQGLDGLGMLVEQAAESFYIWRGVRPDTSSVLGTLRKELTSWLNTFLIL